jgi:hypothetical protein
MVVRPVLIACWVLPVVGKWVVGFWMEWVEIRRPGMSVRVLLGPGGW